MQNKILSTPISYLNGIGAERAQTLNQELKLYTYADILMNFPFRYVDRTQYYKIGDLNATLSEVQIIGTFRAFREIGANRKKRWMAHVEDETGSLNLVWFKTSKWQRETLEDMVNRKVIVYGKVTEFQREYNITHPEIELVEPHKKQAPKGLFPVYRSTEKVQKKGITQRVWTQMAQQVVSECSPKINENLPPTLLQKWKLPNRKTALQHIHFPPNPQALAQAAKRLKIEEFFFLHLAMRAQKNYVKKKFRSHPFPMVGDYFNQYYQNHLGFSLTQAQKRVIKEIRQDLGSSVQMNRLLQGDVGSGKTIVAVLCMLIAADNGFQSLMLAPTEILAQQHYHGIASEMEKLGLKTGLLTGSTPAKERKVLHQALEDGSLHFLVGTHALLEDKVQFANLGLAIIDEQHRFGVAQRAKLWTKNDLPPHMLIMTATPIPRTLAMTLYGDLDLSVIDELPAGRKPIKTVHRKDKHRLAVFKFLKDEIAKGRQVYIVYPLIEESKSLEYKDLMDGFESVQRYFPLPQYATSIVHGKMKPADKAYEMERFVKGETQIMVATTVIEVGVNVPNASVMIIESAEKFGLSQLHQLRGRVGRGAEQSYCILMTKENLNETAYKRIQTMCATNDGFRIAEVDLELRGPGDVMGTQQSGLLDLKIADLGKDKELFALAKYAVEEMLNLDPSLEQEEHQNVKTFFQKHYHKKLNWLNVG